jgi:LDH2 family malate/lactate/ureidoglycolate dehydrogenase
LPTEDPYEGYEGGGSLTPVGGHKGYGMALVNEILTAVLTGGKVTSRIKSLYEEDRTGIQGTCHSFMAIDPDCFIGKEPFKRNMDHYIKSIKESAKAKDATEILMPGEPELRTETERLRDGIPLAEATLKDLAALGESLGIALPPLSDGT